ncbi:MAG TPA: cyclic nucleotide-binding domain-containing protein [Kofleriaceae bacterium]|nr:cyclic nucleotide-binding domain-containing protein [Kofleriaceae bacterium]
MSQESPTPALALGHAAARLVMFPNNLGAWWELAQALTAAGQKELARKAYSELGMAASRLGHAALAVACARALDAAGEEKAADKLIDHIARDHGRGSRRIDPAIRSAPPAPPPAEPSLTGAPPADAPTELEPARAMAEKAIKAAAAASKGRAPDTLAPIPLIGVLDAGEMRELCSVMELRRLQKGDVVVDVGQPADALYWIARGSVSVARGDKFLGELVPNQFFGEIALVLGDAERTARVTAAMRALLLVIPAEQVEKVAASQPRLGKVLANHARARLLATVMRTSELFQRLDDEERTKLLPLFETEMFAAGDTIIHKGAEDQRLVVVASGRCQMRDGDTVLAELETGDGMGEASLLTRRPAPCDVVAVEQTVVLSLAREKFDEVAVNHPGLLAEVYRLLVQREQENRALVHDASELVI